MSTANLATNINGVQFSTKVSWIGYDVVICVSARAQRNKRAHKMDPISWRGVLTDALTFRSEPDLSFMSTFLPKTL
jgi:hypothetical protein